MNEVVQRIYSLIMGHRGESLSKGISEFIGIDGLDCSGKTHFAQGLADAFAATGLGVNLIHIDDFNNIEVQRRVYDDLAEGRLSDVRTDEYYEDGIDYARATPVLQSKCGDAGAGGVVILEGVMLQRVMRPIQAYGLTYLIYLDVDPDVAEERFRLRRAAVGDTRSVSAFRELWLPAHQRYLEEFDPRNRAHMVIDNNDYASPRIVSCKH